MLTSPDQVSISKALSPKPAEHVDVLIVGAGISGIGSAFHLIKSGLDTSFLVLEALDSFGGTWLTHRYPGVRSDSDLHTFGYSFKAWRGPPIGTAAEIRSYMGEVIAENDLAKHIRYKHRIVSASWSSARNLWSVEVIRTDTGERLQFTCNFLWMCQGYYRHSKGYTPEWPDFDKYKGVVVHPQTWPENLDTAGKKVVVIGSGATAATLIPNLAPSCGHVVMLQRSPTYFITGRNRNDLAEELRSLEIDEAWVHEIVRRKVLKEKEVFMRAAVEHPEKVRRKLIENIRGLLGPDFDVDTHFSPKYRPWQQRVAYVPDGDLFNAINGGSASVVTDEIERFTEDGILLKSGKKLDADIVITATGFSLSVMGDIAFTVDEKPVDWAQTVTYRGMMFTGVPNLVWVFGYFRASWTLRTELVAEFVCRLLAHMKDKRARKVQVALRPEDEGMPLLPWMDAENFNPGYLMRDMHRLPKSGNKRDWQHTQDYWNERREIPAIDFDNPEFVYG